MVLADFQGRAPVHWAAIHGNRGAVELLKSDLALTDLYDWNCLHLAVMHRRDVLVEYLIAEAGLDVNATGNDGRTPLYGAVACCESNIVKMLIQKHARINMQENRPEQWSPLHYAVKRGNLEILEILLESDKGRKALHVKSTFGDTPLHLIAHFCKDTAPAMATIVCEFLDGDVNSQNDRGETPLHKAVEGGDLSLASILLDAGATGSLNLRNRNLKTPLDIAKGIIHEKEEVKLEWDQDMLHWNRGEPRGGRDLGNRGRGAGRQEWSRIKELLENYETHAEAERREI